MSECRLNEGLCAEEITFIIRRAPPSINKRTTKALRQRAVWELPYVVIASGESERRVPFVLVQEGVNMSAVLMGTVRRPARAVVCRFI